MGRYTETTKDGNYTRTEVKPQAIVRDVLLILGALVLTVAGGCPFYNVWEQGLHGQAELARAQQNRMIKVQEAEATKESAILLADAEVSRAEGVAKANKIIGNSLKDNEAYLRYLWIHQLGETKNQTIYIPTEAGLPILEAGKRQVLGVK